MTTVELYYSSAWHDVTSDVLTGDGIRITRGRTSPSQRVTAGSCTLSFKNDTGKYSPRNSSSALYGLIGRNTPVRVSVGSSYRFTGEIESWPQSWDLSGNVVWAPVTAYGILRRLGGLGTTAPAFSAQYRAHTVGDLATGLVEWWPLETGDLREQSRFPSGVTGSGDLIAYQSDASGHLFGAIGGITPGPAGATSATDLSGGAQLFRYLTPQSPQTAIRVEMSVKAEPFTTSTFGTLLWLRKNTGYAGTELFTIAASGTDGETGVDFSGPGNGTNRESLRIDDGVWHHMRLDLAPANSGADTTYELAVDGTVLVSGTQVGATYAYPYLLQISPGTWCKEIAHVGVWAGSTLPTDGAGYDAFTGYAGETAKARIERVCGEEDIGVTVLGTAAETLGPQPVVSSAEILQRCAEADGGYLGEAKSLLGIVYVGRDQLYNQTVALALSYTNKDIAPPLQLLEDTDLIVNDVTVTRPGGGSARSVQETGTLNITEPSDGTDGVGRYAASVQLDVETDDRLPHQAGWRRHVGTTDVPRYTAITLDLTAWEQASKTTLLTNVELLDLAERVTVADPPAWTGGEDIDQLVQGISEYIGPSTRTITLATSPAAPYDVAELDNTGAIGKLGTMTLAL